MAGDARGGWLNFTVDSLFYQCIALRARAALVLVVATMAPLAHVCSAVPLQASQAAVLQECAAAWNRTFSGWTAGADCLLAKGITCDAEGMVDSMFIGILNLNGTIPTSISNLTALNYFDLSMNHFYGPIPPVISRLSLLANLNLGDTRISGPIPSTIGALKNLQTLTLTNTSISGSIPSIISALSSLTYFDVSNTRLSGTIPGTIGQLANLVYLSIANTNLSGSLPASLGALPKITEAITSAGVTCGRSGSSCEIQQNASSLFCRVLCFDFCASCIPINGQRRHPPPPPPLSPPLPPSLALIGPPPPPLSSLLAVSSPLAPPPAPPPYTGLSTSAIVGISLGAFLLVAAAAAAAVVAAAYVRGGPQGSKQQPLLAASASRVFGRARCPKFPVSLVAHATGGWSEVNWLEKQGWSSISNSTTSSIIGSSSSGGQRYKVVSPLDARQVWFVVRRGNDELSTDFQKEVATLWSIRHTNLQRLLGYCWEKPGSADSTKSTGAEKAIAYSAPAASVHALEQAEEQVLVFEWVPGGNLHSRLVAEGCSPLSVWQCLDVTAGVLRGLKHIQSHGVVHGRIHPRNILLDTALQPVLAGCMAVKMGDPLPSIPTAAAAAAAAAAPPPPPPSASASPTALSASAGASVGSAGRFTRPPANHAYMDPILLASARTTPSSDVFSIGVVMLQLITGRPALIPTAAGNDDRQGTSSGSGGGGSSSNSSNSISTNSYSSNSSNSVRTNSYNSSSSSSMSSSSSSEHIREWAQHMVSRNITANLRAAHLPSAPDAIVLPMVRLALSCTASDPLSRPTVTDLLRSIKALKRSLSAHPRPALPANVGTSRGGDMHSAAGGGDAAEQQGGEHGDVFLEGFSQNALDAKLDWLLEEEDSGRFVADL